MPTPGKTLRQAPQSISPKQELKITSLWFNLTLFNYKGNVSNE